jgi:VanZ family protein
MYWYQKLSLVFVFVTLALIFYVSSLVFPPTVPGFSYTSILYHFSIFAVLIFFLLSAGNFNRKYAILALLVAISYAGLDELHQLFVPNRVCDWFDFFTDTAGIFSGLGFYSLIRIFRKA